MVSRKQSTVILLLIYLGFAYLSNFSIILDCGIAPGCPLDHPDFVVSLDDIFGGIKYGFAPKEVLCAFLCQTNKECASFNQLPNNECQMFRSLPFKIVEGSNCKLFQKNSNDGECYKNVTNSTNLTFNRPTCQSSTYVESGNPLYSWLAVDGLNGTDPLQIHCSHTNYIPAMTIWFMVKLIKTSKVTKVRVLVRYVSKTFPIAAEIIRNLTVRVTNNSWPLQQAIATSYNLCGYYNGPLVSANWIDINCSLKIPSTNFVVVHQGIPDGNLCVCEIQVFGFNSKDC